MFHTVFPEKSNWRLILSYTNIFNIFNSIRKILEGAYSRKTKKYIPQNAFWLNRLFFDLASTNDKLCLTINLSGVNKDGPGTFRTKADNPEFQFAILIKKMTNRFIMSLSVRINNENENDFDFKIVRQNSNTNKNVTFESSEELDSLKENDSASSRSEKRARTAFGIRSSSSRQRNRQKNPLTTVVRDLEKELNQDFSIEDNVVRTQNIIAKKEIKPKKVYSSMKVKAQNFLTSLSNKQVK